LVLLFGGLVGGDSGIRGFDQYVSVLGLTGGFRMPGLVT
jgi:hypothetical protein